MTFADQEALKVAILDHLAALPAGKAVSPQNLAMELAGKDEKEWSRLMKPLRAAAIALASEGRACIIRKGKPVDGSDFKGLYKIAMPIDPANQGDGNS